MRQFVATNAKREHVPLLIGLFGPSGGGKTYSALRLATGIVGVSGGNIVFVDTEARRGLHYADQFTFKHIQFDAPFGSLDYLNCLQQVAKTKPGCIIVDSMSHEHDGEGGYIQYHDTEADRLSGGDAGKRDRVNMLAWTKPSAARQRMISGILQLNTNFVFCFRAKEKSKPARSASGKIEVQELGYMPICGDTIAYEMTINMLLLPNAGGIPTWQSEQIGEKAMMKLPLQFRKLFSGQLGPLAEVTGKRLALWARGDDYEPTKIADAAKRVEALQVPNDDPIIVGFDQSASMGTTSLRKFWDTLTADEKVTYKIHLENIYKPMAAKADAR